MSEKYNDDFESRVEIYQERILAKLRKWDKEKAAEEIHREYLSEEGLYTKSSSKLEELLDERHKLALTADDPNIRMRAIDSSLAMASGPKTKIVATQNNQYNFSSFIDSLKDE